MLKIRLLRRLAKNAMTNTGKIWSSTVDDCLWVSWSVESLNRSDILNEYPAPTKITRMPVTNTTLMVSVWKKTVSWKPMCDMVCLIQGWISGVRGQSAGDLNDYWLWNEQYFLFKMPVFLLHIWQNIPPWYRVSGLSLVSSQEEKLI